MQCTMCDAAIPDDAQFCIICGAAVARGQTGPTQRLSTDRTIALDPAMVTSAFTLPGFRLVHSLGIVRGLTVRSASFGGQIAAAFQSLGGGNIRTMTTVCEHARTDASSWRSNMPRSSARMRSLALGMIRPKLRRA